MIATQPKARQILGVNQQAYQSLKASMSLNLRRQLLIAVCDNVVLQNHLATQLEKDLAQMSLQSAAQPADSATVSGAGDGGDTKASAPTVARLTFDPEEGNLPKQVAYWVRQTMLEAGELPAVQVLGIEQMTRQPAITQNYFLRSLEKVEALLPRLNTSLLVWVPWPWLRTIQESAPTFWKWRSGVFEFVSDPTPTGTEEAPLLPELSLLEDATSLIEANDFNGRASGHNGHSAAASAPADELYGEGVVGSAVTATEANASGQSADADTRIAAPTELVQNHSVNGAMPLSEQGEGDNVGEKVEKVGPEDPSVESAAGMNSPEADVVAGPEPVADPKQAIAEKAEVAHKPAGDVKKSVFEDDDILTEALFAASDDAEDEANASSPAETGTVAGEPVGQAAAPVVTAKRKRRPSQRNLGALGGLRSVVSQGINISPPDEGTDASSTAQNGAPSQPADMNPSGQSQRTSGQANSSSSTSGSTDEPAAQNQTILPAGPLPAAPAAESEDSGISEAQKAERQKAADDYFAVGHVYRSRIESGERGLELIEPAIAAYEGGLRCLVGPHPDWGSGLNDLGTLYWLKAQQVQDQSQAIDCMTHSIQLYRQALTKVDVTQQADIAEQLYSNMGAVYSMLATFEEPVAYLKQAAVAYQKALPLCELEDYPQEYATLQNSLGSVYWKLSHYESVTDNLHQAIAAYNEAIKGYDPGELPLDYAAVQNNLGITYWSLAKHEPPVPLLKHAIAAYCDALNYRTPEADPAACAITYNNLALAYWDLSKNKAIQSEQKGRYQKNAVTAFEAALNTAQGVDALSQMDSAAIYHCLGDVHIQMVETAPSIVEVTDSLNKSLYSYIKAIEGLPTDSPAFQGRLAAIVANLRTHYDHLGLAGQQAALNRIPPALLSQVMMAM